MLPKQLQIRQKYSATRRIFNYLLRVWSNISNKSDSALSGSPNTEKRVKNTPRSEVFLTKFEVFG